MNQAEIKIYVDSGSYILLDKYTWCPQSYPSLQHHNALQCPTQILLFRPIHSPLPEFLAQSMKEVKIFILVYLSQGQEQTSHDILSSAVND